jgi:hypothetical protein
MCVACGLQQSLPALNETPTHKACFIQLHKTDEVHYFSKCIFVITNISSGSGKKNQNCVLANWFWFRFLKSPSCVPYQ